MTSKSDNNLEPGMQQSVMPSTAVGHDQNTEARVVRKFGPGADSWYIDTIATPSSESLKDSKAETPKTNVSLKSTVNDIKNGFVKSAKKLKSYLLDGSSEKKSTILKAQKKAQVETFVDEQVSPTELEQVLQPPVKAAFKEPSVKTTSDVLTVDEPESQIDIDEVDNDGVVVEIDELVPLTEEVVISLADNITQIIAEAEEELKQTNDVLTGIIVGLAKELNTELRKEKLNWSKIDLLVRQLSVMLVQKMANNDHKTIQEELDQLQRDIDKVAKTYKGKWEMGLGIISGAFSIIGGAVGLAGGFGALGGVASSTLKSLQGVSQALGSVGQGVGQFGSIARNANERDRAVHQYEMERDRGYKSNADESLRNSRTTKNAQINQMNSSIESLYRAFLAVASS